MVDGKKEGKGFSLGSVLFGEKAEKKKEKAENPLEKEGLSGIKGGTNKYRLVIENPQKGVESYYFAILGLLKGIGTPRFGLNFNKIYKIGDVYKASESSAFWGSLEQRKGLQQEKASQYLKGISEMIKGLFQMIRELRVIDERVGYYERSKKGEKEDQESAEIALKGIWVDLVEGGAKNPGSVYGLAREVGFVTLPDLFFKIRAKNATDVDNAIKKLEGINRKVKEVLARKLFQYYQWKERTEVELKNRKNFLLKYMRQHYHTMKEYISWIKPYLLNIRKLQLQGTTKEPEVVMAFETSKIELELIAYTTIDYRVTEPATEEVYKEEFKNYFPVLKIKFSSTTIPQISFQEEGQRGAIHLGSTEITIEAFVAKKEQIDEYVESKATEELELLSSINSAMDSMMDEIKKYLKEAGETFKDEESKKEEKEAEGILSPFKQVFEGFKDIFASIGLVKKKEGFRVGEKKAAESLVKVKAFLLWDVFKKLHGLQAT
ncbi:hypothetical protein HY498_05495 [Candidatus Woesearchaeota archaeon]|nr:hypothetical protein [Candidatus Woesearchaeota archaeon]